jgi:hypothetical protein
VTTTTQPATAPPSSVARNAPPRAARRRARRHDAAVVAGLAVLAAVGGAIAPGASTAIPAVDVALRALLAAVVTVLARRAPPSSVLVAAGVALVASSPDVAHFAIAFVVFAAALWAACTPSARGRPVNAAIGGATFQVLLRLPASGPERLSAAIAAVATATIVVAGVVALDRRTRQRFVLGAAAVAGICVVLTALVAASVLSKREHLDAGVAAAQAGFSAARRGDTPAAVDYLERAQAEFRTVEDALDTPWASAARGVPLVGQQTSALRSLVTQATQLAQTGALMAREANVDGLHVTNGRIDPTRVAAMRQPLDRVESALATARHALDRTRSPWLVPPIADRVESLDDAVHKAARAARTASVGVAASPRLLGVAKPQQYFVMFTTPAESRAGGGFMGNWAMLTVTNGQFELTRFGRTEELNDAGDAAAKHIDAPADYVARYAPFHPAQEWRNINMSPDFPSVAQAVDQLYQQSGGQALDGVIAIDPEGLAQLIRLTGPIAIAGRAEPLTATNAAQFLLRDQYVAFGDTGDRIDFLDNAAHTITNRLMTSSLPSPSTVGRVLGDAARGGHLRAYSFDRTGERLFHLMGVGSEFPGVRTEVVGLSTQNGSGDKIDVFLHRSLRVDLQVDPSHGRVSGTAEVHLRNDAPTSGLPDYVIGNSLPGLPVGSNRTYFSFYSRLHVVGATLQGQQLQLDAQRERGLNVYSAFVTIPAGVDATLRLELSGSARFTSTAHGHEYRLRVWRQSTVNPDDVDVRITADGGWGVGVGAPTRGLHVDGDTAQYAGAPTRDVDLRVAMLG